MKNTCISSRGIYLTSPLTTVRGLSSPTSISSTYNESASGCFWAFVILPTRMSSLATDIISGSAAALGFVACFFLPPSVYKYQLSEWCNNTNIIWSKYQKSIYQQQRTRLKIDYFVSCYRLLTRMGEPPLKSQLMRNESPQSHYKLHNNLVHIGRRIPSPIPCTWIINWM